MAHHFASSHRATPAPVQQRAVRTRRRRVACACVLASSLAACGGGGFDPVTLDLGGGIAMTADGGIVVAADRVF
jgi:anaerobic glycerol-3-phosphate dehydrogenase